MTGFEIESKKVNTIQFVKEGFKPINQHFQGKKNNLIFVAQLTPLLHIEEILINSSPNELLFIWMKNMLEQRY